MNTKPEVVNRTSSPSSSSSSSSDFLQFFPYPYDPLPKKSPFLPSSEDDSVENPSVSADDSDDYYKEGTSYSQPPAPLPQCRPRASNPPLPMGGKVVLGLPAPGFGASTHIA